MTGTVHSKRGSPGFMVLRFACWLLAVATAIWAVTDARFRDDEGFLLGTVAMPIAACFALIVLGVAVASSWRVAGALLSLAMLGHGAALQMIDAGPRMHYQHYRPMSWLVEHAPWALGLLVMQSLVMVIGFRRTWPTIRAWLRANVAPWQLVVMAVAFVMTSATLSREPAFYAQELAFATWVQAATLGVLVLAAMAVPDESVAAARQFVSGRAWSAGQTMGIDRVVLMAAVFVTVLSATLSIFSYQRHPHIGDEVSYLYQARYLATGALTMPVPPVLDAFNLDLFDFDATRWYASAPPGWPVILAVGVRAGAAWLVNPLLAGVCVVLTWVLVRRLYDERTARISALLLAASPWHSLVGMTFMTHSSSLACALAAACCVAKARDSGRATWALAGGLATGMVGMIRPLEGMILVGLLGLWIIGVGGRRLSLSSIVAWGAGGLVIGTVLALYNRALTGDPLTFPINTWADRYMGPNSNSLGFGPDRGVGWALDPSPGHGVFDGVVNANLNITTLSTELFGWGIGSLLLVMVRLVSRPWRHADYLMLTWAAAVFVAHFFYYFSGGPDFAARYWYLMLVPLIALSASGLQVLTGDGAADSRPGSRVPLAVVALIMMGFVNFTTWRAIDKYHHYLGLRPDARELAASHPLGRSLVLIRGRHSPDFVSAATYNPIDLVNPDAPVFAFDEGAALRARLLPLYADRPVYIVEGPSLTGKGFQVVEGPLTAQALLSRDRESAARNQWHPPYSERLPEEFGPLYTKPRTP